jgi:hypothetical protein
MSNQSEQFADAMRTSQEAVVGAVESWTKSVQSAFGQTPGIPTLSVDPNQVIDQVFDFAEKMLEVQREFAKNLAQAATTATGTMREQAETVGAATRRAAESVGGAGRRSTEEAGTTTRKSTEAASQTARKSTSRRTRG